MHLVLLSAPLLLLLVARVAKSDRPFCGIPPEIKNAYLAEVEDAAEQLEFEVGTDVVYNCQYGYVARGRSRTIRCDQIGDEAEWRDPDFSCSPQTCGDPGRIINGYRIGSLFTFPNNVTYHCDDGYVMHGIEGRTRYCQTSGQWSGRLPVCEVVTCDDPKDVPNGYVTASSNEFGATLTYRCDPGYRLSSKEEIYCTESGTWSKTDVTCEEILCEMPKKPEFGFVNFRGGYDSPRAGSIVVYSCEEGRIPSGPTTSKCLSLGNWTFAAPKCLEPCTVQSILNGVIGKKESGWVTSTVFRELEAGTRVKEDETLAIRCYEGFEVPGSQKQETKITCKKGRWSSVLECNPASCRSSPPQSRNAKIVHLDRNHEGFVSYDCLLDYRKTIEETVVCSYGQWNGDPPQCKSTKCSVDSLTSAGIVKRSKLFYYDGEIFSYTCDYPRYQKPPGHNGQIQCVDGSWTGESPFCVAASCTIPPPPIAHGRVKNSTMQHGSVAKYVCEDSYSLVSNTLVQCSFGKWIGQPPKCQDSRCFLNNLSYKWNISPYTQTITPSGYELNVICDDGYSANTKLPVCDKGIWKGNTYEPLCKESDCEIPRIPHGSLKEEIFGDWYFTIRLRYERKLEYKMIPEGHSVPSGKKMILFCEYSYTFQGTEHQNVAVQCSKGRWLNDPVCLRRGQRYIPTTTVKPRVPNPITNPLPPVTTSPVRNGPTESARTNMFTLAAIPNSPAVTTNQEVTTQSAMTDLTSENPEDQCSCDYPLYDDNVVAHANGKRLRLGNKVQNGGTVIFRCLHIGYHHLIGRTEITCTDCQPWHSSDFPSCIEPKKGNVVIILDDKVKVLEDGTIEINKRQNVSFSCIAVESAEYPIWTVPKVEGISFQNETKERKEFDDILFKTHFYLQDADYNHEGIYHCYTKNNEKTTLNIIVTDPDIQCPEFANDNDIIIRYEKGRRENSKAFFSCPDKNQELVGEAASTCLRTKEWSESLPNCTVRCKKLEDDDFIVEYTNNQEIGSLALFRCSSPGIRVEESSAECLENGLWSHPPPSCKIVKCKILNATDSLTITYSGDRQVNTTANFHCYQPAKRRGVSSTKCLQNGSWADPMPTCRIPPCTKDSLLSSLPPNAQPAINIGKEDSFSLNTTVKLACKNEMVVIGNPLATCGKGSKWSYDRVECGSGCQLPTRLPNSAVKFSPEKDVYNFGDQVTLSCPPGLKLDSESEVIACLMNGWSDKVPDCIRDEKKEDKTNK